MQSFDFKKNAKLFDNEEAFNDKLYDLRYGRIKSICGSICYEWSPDYEQNFKIKFKDFGEGPEYVLTLVFKGREIYYLRLGDDCSKIYDRVEWFFGKAPDDDTFWNVRRSVIWVLLVNGRPKDEDDYEDRLYYLNNLFNTNM